MGIIRTPEQIANDLPYEPRTRYFEKSEGRTKQAMKDECDVNLIVQKFENAGLPFPQNPNASFADVSEVGVYRDLVERVRLGEEFFMQLPAKVRAEFQNDAANLMEALADPAQQARLVELEIIPKPSKAQEVYNGPETPPGPVPSPPVAPGPPAPPEPALPAPTPVPTPPA